MTAPLISVPAIQAEGFEAMVFGTRMGEQGRCPPEYRSGFCFVPYAIGTTERANFLQGCCFALFGALH